MFDETHDSAMSGFTAITDCESLRLGTVVVRTASQPGVLAIDENAQSTLIWIGVGFGAAVVVIIAAFFQDILMAIARILGGQVAASSSSAGRALQRGARFLTRNVGTAVARPRNEEGVTDARRTALRPRESVQPANRTNQETADSDTIDDEVPIPAKRTTGRPPVSVPAIEVEPTLLSINEPMNTTVAPPPHPSGVTSTRNDPLAIGELSNRRQYSPSSRIHIEEKVRDFLLERGGSTTVESLVRHLDREFGAGLGVGLIEASKNRGLIVTKRSPVRTTEIIVELADSGKPRSADGQTSR